MWQYEEWEDVKAVTSWNPPHVEPVRGTDAFQFRWEEVGGQEGGGWRDVCCHADQQLGAVTGWACMLLTCLRRLYPCPALACPVPLPAVLGCSWATVWRCGWGSSSAPRSWL